MSKGRTAFALALWIAFVAAVAIAATQGGPYAQTRPVVFAGHPIAPPVDLNPCSAGACW